MRRGPLPSAPHSLDAVQQPAPSIECLPAREASLQHRAGVLAHGCDAFVVRGEQHERLGKRVGMAGLDDKAARVLLHKARDFSILRGDRDDRTTGGRNAVKLARDDVTLTSLQNYERGRNAISGRRLDALASALLCKPIDLLIPPGEEPDNSR